MTKSKHTQTKAGSNWIVLVDQLELVMKDKIKHRREVVFDYAQSSRISVYGRMFGAHRIRNTETIINPIIKKKSNEIFSKSWTKKKQYQTITFWEILRRLLRYVSDKRMCVGSCLGVSETEQIFGQAGGVQNGTSDLLGVSDASDLLGAKDLVANGWIEWHWVWLIQK